MSIGQAFLSHLLGARRCIPFISTTRGGDQLADKYHIANVAGVVDDAVISLRPKELLELLFLLVFSLYLIHLSQLLILRM